MCRGIAARADGRTKTEAEGGYGLMLKPGVDLRKLHECWGVAFPIIQRAYNQLGYECIVTSANDGRHSEQSLHYSGKALDLRSKHVKMMHKQALAEDLKNALGHQFDVVLESVGMDQEHIHIEFDPKDLPASEEA